MKSFGFSDCWLDKRNNLKTSLRDLRNIFLNFLTFYRLKDSQMMMKEHLQMLDISS